MIRILVADDHAIVREGLKKIVEETADVRVAAEASTGQEALELSQRDTYDVVLLDIGMPGRSWLDTLRGLRAERPETPVLILSVHSEGEYAMRALKSGAAGFLNKARAPSELVAAIRTVSQGKKYVTASLAQALASLLDADAVGLPHDKLSEREYQVLCLIASGKSVKDISDTLCLSPKTVSTYRSRILEKMNLRNNAELTHYAIRQGLVT